MTAEPRKVALRTVIDYPAAPLHRPTSLSTVWENDDKRWVERSEASLSKGQIIGQVCQEAGDPPGPHHLEIFAGTQSLYSVDFELAPNDNLFEWQEQHKSDPRQGSSEGAPAGADGPQPANAAAPVAIDNKLLDEKVVLLLQGKNATGKPIYTYLQLTLRSLQLLKETMRAQRDFQPKDFGTVVASGEGEPGAALRARMAKEYNMTDMPKPRN